MAKKSKMFKGAAVSEAIVEDTKAPTMMPPEEEIFLEPEERDIPIYIYAPKHCKSFRKLADKQFLAGTVTKKGSILLPDGQVISAGATVKTLMKPELKRMLWGGVFLAGKAPRKENGTRKVL